MRCFAALLGFADCFSQPLHQILINAITALSHVLPQMNFEDYYEAVLPRLIIPKPACLLLYETIAV